MFARFNWCCNVEYVAITSVSLFSLCHNLIGWDIPNHSSVVKY